METLRFGRGKLKLHHIRDVLAVAESGSLRAAGRHLGITQPAISRSIRDIECDLGAPLFERHANGVCLTPAGEIFVRRAEVIRSEMRHVRDEIEQFKGNFTGQVSMAISPGAAIALTPSFLPSFRKRYPQALLRLTETFFQPIERSISSGDVDFFIGAYDHELSSTSLSVDKISDNERVILARRGHPLANAKTLGELASAQWIRPSFANRPDEVAFDQMFVHMGLPKPMIAMHTTSTLMTVLSIVNSDLLTMLPVQWLEGRFTRDLVEPIILDDTTINCAPLCIVKRSDVPLTPIAEHLCDLARKAAVNYTLRNEEYELGA